MDTAIKMRWRGIELDRDDHGMLVDPRGQTRIDVNGHVQMLQKGCVDLTVAPRFGVGPYDSWLLDGVTGLSVAWRGIEEVDIHFARFTVVLTLDGQRVILFRPTCPSVERDLYGDNTPWLATRNPLTSGEIRLNALPPKSLNRRVRRARRAGATLIPDTQLLVFRSPQPGPWPPIERDRSKRGRPQSMPWDARGQGARIVNGYSFY